ncbi:hypothetical protein CLPU_10c01330 [Gottschalkia purinilytica]|uniref:L,D-TPase catalytic domain-containing protein n=1 Tax=Gottschalkia purinilytica TaxID=1503 RepID=A0A0L0W946_GOTPU|nr:L,D-transpeptidase family protein [Gottschalkia purinilytica]KNF08078.1 hypothetical protein CLPU_10c01330 [Gottschalkia purinilytica]
MAKRILLIIIGFICVITVILVGTFIINNVNNKDINSNNKNIIRVSKMNSNNKEFKILIEIDTKYLYLIDKNSNTIVKKYIVATGKEETPTPIGSFKVTDKGMWGEGFGTRWLGLNVPWGRYGIHGTNKPYSIGSNASQGCIRMRNQDVEELYNFVRHNMSVTIIGGPFGPFNHGFRTLTPGDRGSDVQEVQKRLKIKGYYSGDIDGVYGESLKDSLIRFLKDNKMKLTDEIGDEIYEKLDIILTE